VVVVGVVVVGAAVVEVSGAEVMADVPDVVVAAHSPVADLAVSQAAPSERWKRA
jgi:hypothetical protein